MHKIYGKSDMREWTVSIWVKQFKDGCKNMSQHIMHVPAQKNCYNFLNVPQIDDLIWDNDSSDI